VILFGACLVLLDIMYPLQRKRIQVEKFIGTGTFHSCMSLIVVTDVFCIVLMVFLGKGLLASPTSLACQTGTAEPACQEQVIRGRRRERTRSHQSRGIRRTPSLAPCSYECCMFPLVRRSLYRLHFLIKNPCISIEIATRPDIDLVIHVIYVFLWEMKKRDQLCSPEVPMA
jgi:hypothetical protein